MAHLSYIAISDLGAGQPSTSPALEQSFRCEALEGWVASATFVGDADSPTLVGTASLAEASRWSGQWWGVFRGADDAIAVATDYFGLCELFYSIVPQPDGRRTVLASDSFRGILAARRAHGWTNRLREDILLPTLVSHHNQFATRWSSATIAEDIAVVPQGSFLLCRREGVAVVPHSRASAPRSLEAARDAAIESGTAMVRQAIATGLPVHLSLSGGKDSRVALSMLLAAGLERDVTIFTYSGASLTAGASKEILDRDAQLAAVMVARYGLDWRPGSERAWRTTGRRAHLHRWQTYRSGSSFEIDEDVGMMTSRPSIDVQGMGGELTRSYLGQTFAKNYPAWWSAAKKTPTSVREDAESLFPLVCRAELLDPELFAAARSAFVDSLDLDVDGDVIDHIDASYRHYRNRSHSGSVSYARSAGSAPVFPLATAEIDDYTRLLAAEDSLTGADGRVLFELIEATTPDLNVLEFMSPPWPSHFVSRGDAGSWASVDPSVANERHAQESVRVGANGEADPEPGFTFDGRLRENAALLQAAGVSEGVMRRMAHLAHRNARLRNILVAATESARDVLERVEDVTMIRRFTVAPRGGGLDDARDSVFAEEFARRDVSGVGAVISIDDDVVTVTATSVPGDVELACYLFVDGVRVHTLWYQDDPRFVFDRPEKGAQVRASLFVRWRGLGEATRVIDVATPLHAA